MSGQSVTVDFDPSGAFAALDQLAETVGTSVVRTGGQAMAQVMYDEARLRCPIAEKPQRLKGGRYSVPGTLRNSIYQVFSKDNSTDRKAIYHVSWNRKKAPHGHLVEFGTVRAPAHPFLGPAFIARQADCVDVANVAMRERLQQEPQQ